MTVRIYQAVCVSNFEPGDLEDVQDKWDAVTKPRFCFATLEAAFRFCALDVVECFEYLQDTGTNPMVRWTCADGGVWHGHIDGHDDTEWVAFIHPMTLLAS